MKLNVVRKVDDEVCVRNAIVSVSDKSGLESLAKGLVERAKDVVIYSTGGTYACLKEVFGEEGSKRRLRSISDYTGQPEMQGGLVKTLDFKIYLGLLSETYNEAHRTDLGRTGAVAFDLVVANLYPFGRASSEPGATLEDARTHIDIGGPCMVRAAAKNFLRVAVLTDPADYGSFLEELGAKGGCSSLATRFRLAKKAFAAVEDYDSSISAYLGKMPDTAPLGVYEVRDRGLH